ncbi:MAG: hypothetical protein KDD70_17710, partial [Bdellovibrionales bacterium]|nr:hypothetical protein [Bdellovibrionales bacterium]
MSMFDQRAKTDLGAAAVAESFQQGLDEALNTALEDLHLDQNELKHLIEQSGSSIAQDKLSDVMREIDTNGDGVISETEWKDASAKEHINKLVAEGLDEGVAQKLSQDSWHHRVHGAIGDSKFGPQSQGDVELEPALSPEIEQEISLSEGLAEEQGVENILEKMKESISSAQAEREATPVGLSNEESIAETNDIASILSAMRESQSEELLTDLKVAEANQIDEELLIERDLTQEQENDQEIKLETTLAEEQPLAATDALQEAASQYLGQERGLKQDQVISEAQDIEEATLLEEKINTSLKTDQSLTAAESLQEAAAKYLGQDQAIAEKQEQQVAPQLAQDQELQAQHEAELSTEQKLELDPAAQALETEREELRARFRAPLEQETEQEDVIAVEEEVIQAGEPLDGVELETEATLQVVPEPKSTEMENPMDEKLVVDNEYEDQREIDDEDGPLDIAGIYRNVEARYNQSSDPVENYKIGEDAPLNSEPEKEFSPSNEIEPDQA